MLHAVNRPQDAVVRAPSRPRRETSGRAAHAHGRSARVGQAETVADAVKCNDTVLTEFFRDAERAAPPHPRPRACAACAADGVPFSRLCKLVLNQDNIVS